MIGRSALQNSTYPDSQLQSLIQETFQASTKQCWHPMPLEERSLLLEKPLPEQGIGETAALDFFRKCILPYPMGNNHPGFMSWVNSPTTPFAVHAAALGSALNPSVGGSDQSAHYAERMTLKWLYEFLKLDWSYNDLPGVFTSGGSTANLLGLIAARYHAYGEDIRELGLAGLPPARYYLSAEGHSCLQKALETMGHGRSSMVLIPTDNAGRMKPEALATALANRDPSTKAVAVIASAGTVSSGSIDPLEDLADISHRHGIWFHIDGAYGAPAVALADKFPNLKSLRKGFAKADSLATDPHKWLYTPIDAGVIMSPRMEVFKSALSLIPPYLTRNTNEMTWLSDYSIEQTRPFRAIKFFLPFLAYGAESYREAIARDIEDAQFLAAQLRQKTWTEVFAQPELSIVAFRILPPDSWIKQTKDQDQDPIDTYQAYVATQISQNGQFRFGTTRLVNKTYLRVCFVNFRRERSDLINFLNLLSEFS